MFIEKADRTGFADTQSRYVAYAKLHGATSTEGMLETDRKRWPGGTMGGYICWIGDAWKAWCQANGTDMDDPKTQAVHDLFDKWLPDFQEKVTGGRFEI